MDGKYIFYGRPSEVCSVEFNNVRGDRVVQVMGPEWAAKHALRLFALTDDPCLLHTPANFRVRR
jgi:hypothetical protein